MSPRTPPPRRGGTWVGNPSRARYNLPGYVYIPSLYSPVACRPTTSHLESQLNTTGAQALTARRVSSNLSITFHSYSPGGRPFIKCPLISQSVRPLLDGSRSTINAIQTRGGGDSADNPSSLKRSFVVVEWWSSVVGPEAEKEGRKRGARSPPHSTVKN